MKQILISSLSSIILASVLFGCNVQKKDESSTLSYSFTENGCPTGEHTFSSEADLCAGLKSSSLNKNCAYTLRKQMYEQRCAADFASTP